VTHMIRLNEQTFLRIYFSGLRVEITPYVPDDIAYLWNNSAFDGQEDDYVYLVSPKTRFDYMNFIENMKKEAPLLLELG
jgi:hypothetical protein